MALIYIVCCKRHLSSLNKTGGGEVKWRWKLLSACVGFLPSIRTPKMLEFSDQKATGWIAFPSTELPLQPPQESKPVWHCEQISLQLTTRESEYCDWVTSATRGSSDWVELTDYAAAMKVLANWASKARRWSWWNNQASDVWEPKRKKNKKEKKQESCSEDLRGNPW